MTSISNILRFFGFVSLLPAMVFAQNNAPDSKTTAPQTTPRAIGEPTTQRPQPIPGGFDLPNGWRITPAGKSIAGTEDMVLERKRGLSLI